MLEDEPVDPVSGNEIPLGGSAEGVRDDIPAQLSEGEFVIPAHVVRFLGAGQLYQLIDAVEQQIAQMEQGGQMGQPVPAEQRMPMEGSQPELPFDPSELEAVEDGGPTPQGFSEGGLVDTNRTGLAATTPQAANLPSVRMYRDRTGFLVAVPFVNGQAVGLVPEGSSEVTAPSPAANLQPTQNQVDYSQSGGESDRGSKQGPASYDIDKLTEQEARSYLEQQSKITSVTDNHWARGATIGVSQLVPGIGSVLGFARGMQKPIETGLANRVLETSYGVERPNVINTFRGRTGLDPKSNVGHLSPTEAVSYFDDVRDAGYDPTDSESRNSFNQESWLDDDYNDTAFDWQGLDPNEAVQDARNQSNDESKDPGDDEPDDWSSFGDDDYGFGSGGGGLY